MALVVVPGPRSDLVLLRSLSPRGPYGPVVPGPGGAAQTAVRPHGGLVVPRRRALRDDLQPGGSSPLSVWWGDVRACHESET